VGPPTEGGLLFTFSPKASRCRTEYGLIAAGIDRGFERLLPRPRQNAGQCHRSAHEHLGELYLVLGAPDIAEQHLAMLEEICLIHCAEIDDLKGAIAANDAPTTR
jgi:hypothetical protein